MGLRICVLPTGDGISFGESPPQIPRMVRIGRRSPSYWTMPGRSVLAGTCRPAPLFHRAHAKPLEKSRESY